VDKRLNFHSVVLLLWRTDIILWQNKLKTDHFKLV